MGVVHLSRVAPAFPRRGRAPSPRTTTGGIFDPMTRSAHRCSYRPASPVERRGALEGSGASGAGISELCLSLS